MKFTYLGTAAAEGWPAVFCNCDFCNKARKAGGKDIRTRSQAMLGDDVLIDFPGDTYHHAVANSLNLSAVKYVFITHTHSDHFLPDDLEFRGSCFGHNFISPTIEFVGNEMLYQIMNNKFLPSLESSTRGNISATYIPPFTPTIFGDYTLTALKAQHKPDETAYVYLIEKNGKTLLYLHDTGLMPEETFAYLRDNKIKVDFVSYDCTHVLTRNKNGHLGLLDCVDIRNMLAADGVVHDGTVNVINHFSHNCGMLYDDLTAEAEKYGFLVSYDGMVINI